MSDLIVGDKVDSVNISKAKAYAVYLDIHKNFIEDFCNKSKAYGYDTIEEMVFKIDGIEYTTTIDKLLAFLQQEG